MSHQTALQFSLDLAILCVFFRARACVYVYVYVRACLCVTSGKLLSYGGSSFSKRPCVICLTCFDLNVLAVAWGLVQNTVR